MKLVVKDFYSVKHAELELQPGISVLAGKNGAGKTQLLVAIASKGTDPNTLSQLGYRAEDCPNASVEASGRTLFRPSLRRIAEASRRNSYATIGPTNDYLNLQSGQGYLWNLDDRYLRLHDLAGTLVKLVCVDDDDPFEAGPEGREAAGAQVHRGAGGNQSVKVAPFPGSVSRCTVPR